MKLAKLENHICYNSKTECLKLDGQWYICTDHEWPEWKYCWKPKGETATGGLNGANIEPIDDKRFAIMPIFNSHECRGFRIREV